MKSREKEQVIDIWITGLNLRKLLIFIVLGNILSKIWALEGVTGFLWHTWVATSIIEFTKMLINIFRRLSLHSKNLNSYTKFTFCYLTAFCLVPLDVKFRARRNEFYLSIAAAFEKNIYYRLSKQLEKSRLCSLWS